MVFLSKSLTLPLWLSRSSSRTVWIHRTSLECLSSERQCLQLRCNLIVLMSEKQLAIAHQVNTRSLPTPWHWPWRFTSPPLSLQSCGRRVLFFAASARESVPGGGRAHVCFFCRLYGTCGHRTNACSFFFAGRGLHKLSLAFQYVTSSTWWATRGQPQERLELPLACTNNAQVRRADIGPLASERRQLCTATRAVWVVQRRVCAVLSLNHGSQMLRGSGNSTHMRVVTGRIQEQIDAQSSVKYFVGSPASVRVSCTGS